MLGIFSSILAFFFSITSFFTVLFGNNLCTISMIYDEGRGHVWECDIADDDIAVIKAESTTRSTQNFVLEGKAEGRTEVTLTNQDGESTSCIIESIPEINPYNGDIEYYYIAIPYNFNTYISYDEGITLTAETPVDGGYWDFGINNYEIELKSDPETVNGVCTFDVINTSLEDEHHGILFTYYSADGTPLENEFLAFTLKEDGTIFYTPENRLAKVALPCDMSKLIVWNVADYGTSDAADIINIYTTSDVYGGIYLPEGFISQELADALLFELIGKIPVGGEQTVVIEALKEGTAEFTLEKADMYPLVETEDGFTIDAGRYEVLETVTIAVTVDSELNISYEIK